MRVFQSQHIPTILACFLLGALLAPCQTRAETQEPQTPSTFDAVTAKLDPGGTFFMYLSTEAMLGRLSDKAGELAPIASDAIDEEEIRSVVLRGIESLQSFIRSSGLEGIAAFGSSVVPAADGLHRVRSVLQKAPDADGHLWRYFGTAPHPMDGAALLPADTVIASFGDLDLEGIWGAIVRLASDANAQPVITALREASEMVRQTTGRTLEEHFAASAGEMGFALLLDEERSFDFEAQETGFKEIPEPGLLLAIKMKDDALFRWLSDAMSGNPEVARGQEGTAAWISMPAPIPAPFEVRPTVGHVGDYLVLATHHRWMEQVARAHSGAEQGLRGSAEWQRLSTGLPTQGNGFNFFGSRFGATIQRIQQAAMEEALREEREAGASVPDIEAIYRFMGIDYDTASYSVSWMEESGWQSVGHSTSDPVLDFAQSFILAPAAVLIGMAAPAIANARQAGVHAACDNNLRQIAIALQLYAMEHDGDLPPHLAALRGVLSDDPSVFECPNAPAGMPLTWEAIEEGRTAYEYLGAGLSAWRDDGESVVVRCLIHLTEVRLDGSLTRP